jgi:hypothetical protein
MSTRDAHQTNNFLAVSRFAAAAYNQNFGSAGSYAYSTVAHQSRDGCSFHGSLLYLILLKNRDRSI